MKVDWMEGWANNPGIIVLVDRFPDLSDVKFDKKGPLYFAEKDGGVFFFSYRQPGNGFGGRHFTLKMKDGSEEILKGPWSSRSSVMNTVGFTPSIEVIIAEDRDTFERGYTLLAGSMIVEKVEEGLKKFLPGFSLYSFIDEDGEENYELRKNGKNKKDLIAEGYLDRKGVATRKRCMETRDGITRS